MHSGTEVTFYQQQEGLGWLYVISLVVATAKEFIAMATLLGLVHGYKGTKDSMGNWNGSYRAPGISCLPRNSTLV